MRLIDADTATAMTATCPKGMDIDSFIEGMGIVLDRIAEAPTVDAVQVVRCRECKWWFKDENYDGLYRCANDGLLRKGDHYCADGERKYDGKNREDDI